MSTTRRHELGEPEVSFVVDDEATPIAAWLREFLELRPHDVTTFREGELIQVGCSILMLRPWGPGLELWEPDFRSVPIRWCEGVNTTLRHLAVQKSVCDALACSPDFPSLRLSVAHSPAPRPLDGLRMSRVAAAGSDSGWRIEHGAARGQPRVVSLYEMSLMEPWIVPFLALPQGSSVHAGPAGIEVSVGGRTVSSREVALLSVLSAHGFARSRAGDS
jgi:hypothetical protein